MRPNTNPSVVVNPPMIYGPTLQESATSPETLNTSSAAIYQLFSGTLQAIPDDRLPLFCDVRGALHHFADKRTSSLLTSIV